MRRALALVVVAVLGLAGCTATSPSLDLAGVVTEADAPDRMSWVASGTELTAGDDLETFEHEWEDSGGEPQACLPMHLVPYGVAPDDEGSSDRTVELGYFTHDEYAGSILVNAREFPTDQGAIDFVQHALEAANACPGYSIGGYDVAPEGFAIARFTGGHGLSIDGGRVVDGITSQTAVVRAGRTILLVDAFLFEATDFDPEVVDELARTMLERLDADS